MRTRARKTWGIPEYMGYYIGKNWDVIKCIFVMAVFAGILLAAVHVEKAIFRHYTVEGYVSYVIYGDDNVNEIFVHTRDGNCFALWGNGYRKNEKVKLYMDNSGTYDVTDDIVERIEHRR